MTEKLENTSKIYEKAAPGMEDWVKANKKRFVDEYGTEKGLEVLYATSYKLAKDKGMKEEMEATAVDMKVGGEMGDKDKPVKKKGEGDDKTDADAKHIETLPHIDAPHTKPNSPVIDKGEMDENLALMFAGTELSEDFKKKATVIFETALSARLKAEVAKLEEEAAEALKVKLAESEAELVKQIDEFMEMVVEEFMEENKLAIESGVRQEIAESFITDLKSLFEKHNISIPAEKMDMLEASDAENEALRQENTGLTEKLAAKEAEVFAMQKTDAIRGLSEGLAETQKEKLTNLVKEIDAKSIDSFKEKAKIIRESVFADAKSPSKDEKKLQPINEEDARMERVFDTIRRRD